MTPPHEHTEQPTELGGRAECPGPAACTTTGTLQKTDPVEQGVDAATHPAVILTAVGTTCLVIVLLAAAKVAPALTEAWAASAERWREKRQRREDARIVDLDRQVDHLAGRVYTLEQARTRQDAALLAHAVWDQEVTTAAIAAGVQVMPPPPLYPPPEAS